MRKRKVVLIISVLFYLVMGVLAIGSQRMYRADLPKVHICYLEHRTFFEDGTYSYLPALPESFYNRPVYYVQVTVKNKEKIYIVRKAENMVLGYENDGYYPVKDDIMWAYRALIVDPPENITEGQEVLVENEEEILW